MKRGIWMEGNQKERRKNKKKNNDRKLDKKIFKRNVEEKIIKNKWRQSKEENMITGWEQKELNKEKKRKNTKMENQKFIWIRTPDST